MATALDAATFDISSLPAEFLDRLSGLLVDEDAPSLATLCMLSKRIRELCESQLKRMPPWTAVALPRLYKLVPQLERAGDLCVALKLISQIFMESPSLIFAARNGDYSNLKDYHSDIVMLKSMDSFIAIMEVFLPDGKGSLYDAFRYDGFASLVGAIGAHRRLFIVDGLEWVLEEPKHPAMAFVLVNKDEKKAFNIRYDGYHDKPLHCTPADYGNSWVRDAGDDDDDEGDVSDFGDDDADEYYNIGFNDEDIPFDPPCVMTRNIGGGGARVEAMAAGLA